MFKRKLGYMLGIFFLSASALMAQEPLNYYFYNYHTQDVQFKISGDEKVYTLTPASGSVIKLYSTSSPTQSVTIIETGNTYEINANQGNIFFWVKNDGQVGCETNADEFLGVQQKFSCELLNDTGMPVKYRRNGGKVETLPHGYKMNYSFKSFFRYRITVLNSGKTYQLPSGKHKFWLAKKHNSIELDLNYQ